MKVVVGSPDKGPRMRCATPWLLVVLAACPRAQLPKHWELTISSSAGLCEDTETSGCNQSWKVSETGPIVRVERLAAGPKETSFKVAAAQREEIESILRTSAFREGMEDGFPCAKGTVHDLWVHFTYIDRDRGTTRSQNVTACGLGAGNDKDNVVMRLSSAVFLTAR